ncbi:3-hydroxyacyl-CoA dehydrogenase NAD-binding domain-containing protein [Limnobacter sp.]|uniref:3-hydroxyacyl-CoA dehydrogenase NAD-binding domain-containing protein n=1 Tax=Limnobacter sp. TaxID=2003368 RepID=UPI002583C964|nr:3-hydroxyacyl-CoA dehydrogenase NAD-binding domain-containing protein [Limnobacter sp.]HEX5484824.1 3-hydroxyacyl-CoA dehydrogenase NAD-binding domain-containing protein [Limnobacter sp.]
MTAVKFELGADGIAVVTLDMPGRSMNVLNDELMGPYAEVLSKIETDPAVKGVVLTSGKKEFLAGADLENVYKITDPQVAFDLAEAFKGLLRRMEKCTKPFVAALNGTALGGGLELALACNHRIALNNPKAKFGLPEVKLGLLPGGGGTQRLPRIVGIQESLQLMTQGTELRVEQALKKGILNDTADTLEELISKARAWCVANPVAQQPWDVKGFKFPGGDSKHPAIAQLWAIAPSMANAKAYGNYPALNHIASCVFEGGITDIDTGLKVESRYFAACVLSQESKNMMNTLWFQLNAIKKGQSRPSAPAKSQVKKLGILGAGMMGAGIAYVSAKVGIEVVLIDATQEAADKGKAYSTNLLDKAIAKKRSTPEKKDALLSLITATTDYSKLEGADLVIEAVFEDRGVKAEVTAKAEAVIPASAVFASNTSTLPITGLAQASKRPKQFIGLHFFSPVDKMPLVEIICGKDTDDETLAKGFDYVQQIGKTPIVVNDSRGFFTSRVFGTYLMEGAAMVGEGVHPRSIEMAGLEAGMPMPPLAIHDEVSLSLSILIENQTRKDMEAAGQTFPEHPGSKVMRAIAEKHGRIGKKAGKGYYDYTPTGKTLWPGINQEFPLAKEQPSSQEIQDRLMYIQANEAAKCLQEKVLRTVADGNIGSIFGLGFAPFTGGMLQFINAKGLPQFVKRCEELAAKYGERFKPASMLVELAAQGKQLEDVLN